MRILPVFEPAAQLVIRTLKLRVARSFARVPKRRTRTRACHIELPRQLWDRIVFLMFTCCLFAFLRAFFGLGAVDEDLRTLNNAFEVPRARPSVSSPWSRSLRESNGDQEMRTWGTIIDWHKNYELFPSTTSSLVSPASIPQDAFPDPTPALDGRGGRQTPDEGSRSMTTKAGTPMDTPFVFYGTPYDQLQLKLEDSVQGRETRGLYPIAGPPRTAP